MDAVFPDTCTAIQPRSPSAECPRGPAARKNGRTYTGNWQMYLRYSVAYSPPGLLDAANRERVYDSSSRTRGATLLPINSMLVISVSCGSVPALYLILKRDSPSARTVLAILAATVSGEPTHKRAVGTGLALELRARRRRPSAFAADAVDHHLVVRPELVLRLVVGRRDVPRRMHRDRQHRLAELLERVVIEIDVRAEPLRAAADDRERERQT